MTKETDFILLNIDHKLEQIINNQEDMKRLLKAIRGNTNT